MLGYSKFSISEILSCKADVNLTESFDDRTALLYAAESGRPDLIKILLKNGANVNHQDRWHDTALILATQKGNSKSVEILIKYGVDINLNLKDSRGLTALDWSVIFGLYEIFIRH